MAELTPLDEKLGEVLGLAQAAQDATQRVSGMEDADDFDEALDRMRVEAEETERRTDELRRRHRRQEDGDPREGPRDEVRGRST